MLINPTIRAAVKAQRRRKSLLITSIGSSIGPHRSFVKPTAAGKATVLDVPHSRLEQEQQLLSNAFYIGCFALTSDTLSPETGLKSTSHVQKEPSVAAGINPIYLDAQVILSIK